ncbi:hypothetical protein M426DRAFT_69733 [Hypoxylon sp. CI-4A]|nr:hypothetical protein M426DRAFT_69733 [Hypoxylon sp. CI-4A]
MCYILSAWCASITIRWTLKNKIAPRLFRRCQVDVTGNGKESPSQFDEIYPVHFIDQATILRSSVISYSFRYEHVLDPQRLRESLVTLLSSGDWRKLAGRLRQNVNGKLEIHVPRHFSRHRPPIRFSNVDFGVDMDAHPLARRLPRKTGEKPSIHEGCHTFHEFSAPSSLPNDINHYLVTDEPLISLHVNSFTDGTVVSLTFPHSLVDVMGMADILQAWTQVSRGEKTELLETHVGGAKEDIMASVGTADDKEACDTEFVLDKQQTTGLSLLIFVARYAFDVLIHRNVESHHIYLPAVFMAHLRRQTEEELRLQGGTRNESENFMSDGDLITAWGSQMVLSSAPTKGAAMICNVFDMRKRLSFLRMPSSLREVSYIQNLILPSTTLLTADETGNIGVSKIALKVRKSIVEQTSEAQIRGLMRITRTWFSSLGTMPLFASWDTVRIIVCTNWTKAKLLNHEGFASVATTAHTKTRANERSPMTLWGSTLAASDNPRDTFIIYGKDGDGDYWVHAYLRKETWQLIEEELDRFSPTEYLRDAAN